MKWKINIRREIAVVATLVGVSFLVAFSERRLSNNVCREVAIEIDNNQENHFLDEADVLKLVDNSGVAIKGSSINHINLKEIEGKLKYDKHIADAQLFSDLKGNLTVNVKLRRPVARIVQQDAPDAYIAEDGVVMPMSEKYTSRVLLLSGAFMKRLLETQNLSTTAEGKQILEMIEFVNQNKFWKAQIAQMDVNSEGKIILYPEISAQKVEFGRAENIEQKFDKLMLFYKRILPQRGWTKYARVNLEYEGQIIAE
ncbi:MAG: cell division protein FtsQ [Bacteroidetes bacterium]|nr:cell division protein FtsQ [Bacteroidota bacterium]MBS1540986.1 cell division protein FtsQ [Bacteroidota bacterium]